MLASSSLRLIFKRAYCLPNAARRRTCPLISKGLIVLPLELVGTRLKSKGLIVLPKEAAGEMVQAAVDDRFVGSEKKEGERGVSGSCVSFRRTNIPVTSSCISESRRSGSMW